MTSANAAPNPNNPQPPSGSFSVSLFTVHFFIILSVPRSAFCVPTSELRFPAPDGVRSVPHDLQRVPVNHTDNLPVKSAKAFRPTQRRPAESRCLLNALPSLNLLN